ncbi:MAG: ACT domain-containing protein [Aeromicrobium sp.]
MAFLLRVELPDRPGSLGALAAALGGAGADIEAIEIVEHRSDGVAVDDVLLELPPRLMPDALITACHELDGVRVHWISRYNAGASLSMDLEAVETFTQEPAKALEHLVSVVPPTFRTDWAMALRRVDGEPETMYSSSAAPTLQGGGVAEAATSWLTLPGARTTPGVDAWDSTLLAASPGRLRDGTQFVVVVGRHGGPEFLSSEVARLGHMVSLAASVQES